MTDALQAIISGDAPVFLLIAGPNGAGKSTFRVKRLVPVAFPCIDPDEIGKTLFGRHPITQGESLRATQLAADTVKKYFQNRRSVALETVFSDSKGYKLDLLHQAQAAGFRTVLVFIGVDHPQISIARVMDRVEHGGHDVPDDVIEQRFPRCFDNLKTAIGIADLVILVDNSGCYGPQGEAVDGLRHYAFGTITRGGSVNLSNPLPRWFLEFGIGEAITATS